MIGFISTFVTRSLLITINAALSLIYTIYSSPLQTHEESRSSQVVSLNKHENCIMHVSIIIIIIIIIIINFIVK
jgi:hypothetical protein